MDDRKAGMQDSQDSHHADPHPNAGRDSGYVAPVGEDLVGRLTELLAAMETKLLKSNIALRSEIGRQGNIRREQISELTHLIDRRHDGLAGELDRMLASQEEMARGLGKIQGQVDILEQRLDKKRERLDALETQVRELRGPEMPPEQRQRYIAILMRIIAEWEAAHPDDAIEEGS